MEHHHAPPADIDITRKHSCADHGGYFIGEGPNDAQYNVIVAGDEEVRRVWQETKHEFGTE